MNSKYRNRIIFQSWLYSVLIPFVIQIILGFILVVGYFIFLSFLYLKAESGIFNLFLFVYALGAFPYSIFMYFRSGVAVPRAISIKYNFDAIKFTIKNPIILLGITILFLTVNRLYKPPELGFSDIEVIQEKISTLDEDFNKSVYQYTEELKSTLDNQLEFSNMLKSSDNYKIFYNHPDEVPEILNYDREKIDQLNSNYFYFKSQLKEIDKYLTNSKSLLKSRSGTLDFLENRLQIIRSDLETSCFTQIDTINTEKLSRCKKLQESFDSSYESIKSIDLSIYNDDLETIYKNTSSGQVNLQFWNNWLAAAKKISETIIIDEDDINSWLSLAKHRKDFTLKRVNEAEESLSVISKIKDESTSTIIELEQKLNNFNINIDNYEKSSFITRKLVNKAKHDLSSLLIILKNNDIAKPENKIKELIIILEDHFEIIGGLIANLTDLSSGGNYLLNAPNYTTQASSKIDQVSSVNLNIEQLKNYKLIYLQNEISENINDLKLFRQEQAQKIGRLGVSFGNIKDRLEFFIKDAKASVIRTTLKWLTIIIAIIIIFVVIFWYQKKQKILQKTKLLEGKEIETLLNTITNSTEFVSIRKNAVKRIYNYQHSLGNQDIKLLKNVLKKMEKLKSSDDIKVTEELRKATESLELRLMEKRKVNF